MAFIPGATIKGKFKLFHEMTTEELEQVAIRTQIKMMLVLLCSVVGLVLGLIIYI